MCMGVGAGQPAPLKGGGLLKRQMLKKEGGTAEALPAMWNPLSVHTERSKWCAGDSFEPHEFHRFSSAERWKGYLDRRSLPHQRSYGALEGSCSAVSKRTSPRGPEGPCSDQRGQDAGKALPDSRKVPLRAESLREFFKVVISQACHCTSQVETKHVQEKSVNPL